MINTFDHQIPDVVKLVCELMVKIFDCIGITSWKDIYARIRYT